MWQEDEIFSEFSTNRASRDSFAFEINAKISFYKKMKKIFLK